MTKLLSTDAAYALGEEALRAGYEAGVKHAAFNDEDIEQMTGGWYFAWSKYEPSEGVKDLIGDA